MLSVCVTPHHLSRSHRPPAMFDFANVLQVVLALRSSIVVAQFCYSCISGVVWKTEENVEKRLTGGPPPLPGLFSDLQHLRAFKGVGCSAEEELEKDVSSSRLNYIRIFRLWLIVSSSEGRGICSVGTGRC